MAALSFFRIKIINDDDRPKILGRFFFIYSVSDTTIPAYNMITKFHGSSLRGWRTMEKKKKPKYKIGDTVVITMYGTVGKITNVKWLNGKYVYEVNKSEDFYLESVIKLITEYEVITKEQEQIDIEYRFYFGDLVQVSGYGADLFKVVGFRTEIWRYKEDSWEDIIYELYRINDGEWLEASEEELTLVADSSSAENMIQKLDLKYLMKQQSKPLELVKPQKLSKKVKFEEINREDEIKELIDHLLDIYNDYRILYEWFNDQEFYQVMNVILRKLDSIVNNNYGKQDI
jgi:hypothetical protein